MDLHLVPSLGGSYHGATQIARVLSEDWFAREGYCLSCLHRPIARLADNTAVADFRCPDCGELYQLKARKSKFGSVLSDGAYRTFHDAVARGMAPHLLLLHYNHEHAAVQDLFSIHRKLLSPLSIIKRKPLAVTARRAGWVGCNIDLRSLPSGAMIPIVIGGRPVEEATVHAQWTRFAKLDEPSADGGWLRDTLTCIQKLGKEEFHLADLYGFEDVLSKLHPSNRNIQPKIRQQLQVLCRLGIVERIHPGFYHASGMK